MPLPAAAGQEARRLPGAGQVVVTDDEAARAIARALLDYSRDAGHP